MKYISLKRWIAVALAFVTMLSPSLAGTFTPSFAQAASLNSYIKGSGSTVYWYASNGRRYVFPNAAVYRSWTGGNGFIDTISDSTLSTIQLGGNMTYRPGSRLIKVTTDPKVYAVSRYGVLRWVTSETVARSIYGNNWNQLIDDVSDDYFVNYTIGAPIYSSVDYNPNLEYTGVSSPNDNLSNQSSVNGSNVVSSNPYTNSLYPTIDIGSNRSSIASGDSDRRLIITAQTRNSNLSNDRVRIRIYDFNEGQTYPGLLLTTCEQTNYCVVTTNVYSRTDTYTQRYMALAEDRVTNSPIASAFYLYVPVYGTSGYTGYTGGVTSYQSGAITLNVDRSTIAYTDTNRTVNFTATVTSPASTTDRVRIQLVNETTGQVERTCNAVLSCPLSFTSSVNTSQTVTYHAEYRDRDTNALIATSNRQTVSSYGYSNGYNSSYPYSDPYYGGSTSNGVNNSQVRVEVTSHTRQGSYDVAHLRIYMINPPTNLSGVQLSLLVNGLNGAGANYTGTRCTGSGTCLFDFGSDTGSTRTFRAEARDVYGNVITSDWMTVNFDPYQSLQGNFSSQTRVTAAVISRTSNGYGSETIQYTARLSNNDGTLNQLTMQIYDGYFNTSDPVLATCTATRECSVTLTSGTSITRHLYAVARDGSGSSVASSPITVTYGGVSGGSYPVSSSQVTAVSTMADLTGASNVCGGSFGVLGSIALNGSGTVTYQWERSDGVISNPQTISFSQASTQQVNYMWPLSTTYTGWVRLNVLSPNSLSSNQTRIVSQCNGGPTSPSTPTPTSIVGNIYTSIDPGQAHAGDSVRIDTNFTLSQFVGNVRIDVYSQDGQVLQTCSSASGNGVCQVTAARIPGTAYGNYSFYAQATDGAGRTMVGNWFPVRIIQ